MIHYLETPKGNRVTVSMNCNHPDYGVYEDLGCNTDCSECEFGQAVMSIEDAFVLINELGCTRTHAALDADDDEILILDEEPVSED